MATRSLWDMILGVDNGGSSDTRDETQEEEEEDDKTV